MEMKNTGVQFEDELYILKSTSEIGNKGLLRPKMGRTTREKTSPAEESMPKGTEFCGRCLFGEMRLKNVITRQPPVSFRGIEMDFGFGEKVLVILHGLPVLDHKVHLLVV